VRLRSSRAPNDLPFPRGKVNAHVDVLVPDEKAPIVVHRLKYRPDPPDQ
jgi:hypothetical protein